jgi:hypothetical protein
VVIALTGSLPHPAAAAERQAQTSLAYDAYLDGARRVRAVLDVRPTAGSGAAAAPHRRRDS